MSTALASITAESLEGIEGEWLELWQTAPGATPFAHPEWYRAWLRNLGPGEQPVFLSIRLDEELVGVAALAPDPPALRQLGDPEVTDYSGPLCAEGHEGTVAAGIVEWLMEDMTPGLRLWGIPVDSPLRDAFRAAAERFGWTCGESDEAACPRVTLPGDFHAFVAGLGKHDRHELRRKLRRLDDQPGVAFGSAPANEDPAAFDRFLELMRASRDDKLAFLTAEREAFFRDIAGTFGELGIARLGTLTIDGAAAAMTLAFEATGVTYLYNSGYDPEFSHLSVGLLSKARAVEDAIARGQHTFDFLRGDEDYKRHLGGSPRELLRIELRQR